MLASWYAGRAKGSVRALPAVLLGHVVVRQEQVGRHGPAAASVLAGVGAEDGGSQQGLRHPVVCQPDNLQDLGRTRSAEGDALSLPQSAQPSDSIDRGRADPAQDRGADLYAGYYD